MKKKCFVLAVLLVLVSAGASSALDAVSLLTGGNVSLTGDAASGAPDPAPVSRQPGSDDTSPYSPAPNAEECARRAEAIGRHLEDLERLSVSAAATRFGISEEAVVRRKETLSGLKNVYPAIINALSRKGHIEAMLAKRKEDISAPELTLTEKPPYPLNFYNAYIDQLEDLNSQIDDAQYDLDHAAGAAERAQHLVESREAAWRLARDTCERENTPQNIWKLYGAAFLAEAARAHHTLSVLKHENAATVLSARKLARDRHIRLRAYIRDHLDLEEKSFEAQIAELDARVKELETQLSQESAQFRSAQEELEAAQIKYDAARDDARAAARTERDVREDERDGARLKLEHTQGHLNILAARKREWTLRYDIARGAADLAAITDTVRELTEDAQSLDEQLSETQKDMLAMQGRYAAVQKQIDAGAADTVLDLLRRSRASLQAAIDDSLAYSALLFSMKAQERALIDELQEKYRTVPLREKVRVWWQTEGATMLDTELWQSGGYAVRLREFLYALALIVLGNWVVRRAFAMLLWALSKKFSIDETSRRSLNRLFSYLAGMVIFLGALRIVGIPLTAFAFLGGAIAIAIGFGTQDLFKNLVSGILLTLKRPFRLGNVIEAGGVLGTVTDIGVSATVIRTFDEKYAIIPNSELLENQLINWSLSGTLLRNTIDIGVVYGTAPQLVRETLLSVTAADRDVLKAPAPWVRIASFGDSALNFTLCYWLDQRLSDVPAVAARLREDILRALDNAGILMAYPRVDVNLLRDDPAPTPAPARRDDDHSLQA